MNYLNEKRDSVLRKVAHQFGTPLYIYDNEEIEGNYLSLKKSFSNQVDVFYSLKANPNLAIATIFRQLGAGAEVCSLTELKIALLAGYRPRDIIFVGPAKKPEEIVCALENKIYAIACESIDEFNLINELAKTRSVVANIAIRINPAFSIRNASLKMGGVPSQFGIDQVDVFKNKKFFLEKNNINIIGIHVFSGTRILEYSTLIDNTRNIFALSDALSTDWGVHFQMVDIGGGIGVPYFKNETKFDMAMLHKSIHPLLADYSSHRKMRVILESGRYLMASAGIFVTRIDYIKESQGVKFLITDGGMNCHLTAAGYGSLLKRNFPIKLLSESISTNNETYHITGPLCTPADVIGRAVELPEAKTGDYIAIDASGAYGPSASPVLFLGHGYPNEVLMYKDKLQLIRERDTPDDFLRKQFILTQANTCQHA